MVMKWVTMPHVDTDVLTMTMDMQKQKTFTMLYQPTDAATDVWVRFGVTKDGEESFTYSRMSKNSQMGDKDVWSMKMLSSFAPTKVAFFTTEEAAANDAATMSSAVVSNVARQMATGEISPRSRKSRRISALVSRSLRMPPCDWLACGMFACAFITS